MSGLASPWRPFDVCLVYLGLQCFCVAGVGLRLRPPVVVPSFSISDLSTYLSLTHSVIHILTHHLITHSLCTAIYLRARCETIHTTNRSDVYGILLASLWHPFGVLYVIAVGQCAVPRGRMYAWRFPSVPPVFLGFRCFCVTGMGQLLPY